MVWIEIIPLWMAFEDATKPSSKQPFAKHTKKSEAFDTLFLGCMDVWMDIIPRAELKERANHPILDRLLSRHANEAEYASCKTH